MSETTTKLTPLKGIRAGNESDKAVQACNDWLRLGPGRTLPQLAGKATKSNQKQPPSLSLGTVKGWASKFGWAERASAYDNDDEGKKNARHDEVMQEGLALAPERVVKLKRLAELLEGQIYEGGPEFPNVWLRDVKMIGSGSLAEAVELRRFNAPLIGEYRSTLDDLAKETGGRKVKTEVEHSGGLKIKRAEDLTDDELANVIAAGTTAAPDTTNGG